MRFVLFDTEWRTRIEEEEEAKNNLMIAEDYDATKILNFLFDFFTFLIVIIKRV